MHLQHLNNHRNAPHSVVRNRRGFTLVEVLVVMTIIATLLAVGVESIKKLSTSKGVSTAVPLVESVFDQARQVAKTTGVPTRVVIYGDTTAATTIEQHRNRHLRMIGVATARDSNRDPIASGNNAAEWRLVSSPVVIPRGAYFNENLSVHSGTQVAIFPGDETPRQCYVYEFNSEGALITATSDATGSIVTDGQLVIQAGQLAPGAVAPVVDSSARRDAGGFRVFRNGRLATFQSPNQIVASGVDPEF